jgi:hypothetical protein
MGYIIKSAPPDFLFSYVSVKHFFEKPVHADEYIFMITANIFMKIENQKVSPRKLVTWKK